MRIVGTLCFWLVGGAVATAQDGGTPPAATDPALQTAPAAPADASVAPAGASPAVAPESTEAAPASAPRAPVYATPPPPPAPRVEVIRQPLPPERHLGGSPERTQNPYPRSRAGQMRRPLFDGRVALGLGGTLVFSDDPGYDFVYGKGSQRVFDLFAAVDVYRPIEDVSVTLGVSARRGTGETENEDLSLRSMNATLDLGVRYDGIPVLPVFVRAGLGVARARLRIDHGVDEVVGSDATVLGQLGGGVTLQSAPGWFETYSGRLAKLSVGVTFEGGVTLGSPLAPRFDDDASTGQRQIYARPGKLDTTAPYLRILATLRF